MAWRWLCGLCLLQLMIYTRQARAQVNARIGGQGLVLGAGQSGTILDPSRFKWTVEEDTSSASEAAGNKFTFNCYDAIKRHPKLKQSGEYSGWVTVAGCMPGVWGGLTAVHEVSPACDWVSGEQVQTHTVHHREWKFPYTFTGMCSHGQVKPWLGPIDKLSDLRNALGARSYKKEVPRRRAMLFIIFTCIIDVRTIIWGVDVKYHMHGVGKTNALVLPSCWCLCSVSCSVSYLPVLQPR